MKDLDFDELDKAVSSLMAGVPKTPDPSSEAEKTVTIPSSGETPPAPAASPSSISVNPTVSIMQPTKPFTPKPLSAPRPSTVPASRRAGRFMDVVRPAAPGSKQGAPVKVSRQGVALEPVSSNATPSLAEEVSPPSAIDTSEKSTNAPRGDWPDPLDMAGFSETQPLEPEGNDKKPDSAEQEPVETVTQSDTPLTSPFLPDTKVEKRPLGANAIANAGVTEPYEELKPTDQPPEAHDEQLPATLEDTKPILPEELHSDLVAIESDTTSSNEEGVDKPEVSKAWKPSEEPKAEAVAAEPSKPSIPISIPQQYKEEVSTGEKESGAIYDTDSYHKPLAHPTKQKSGWMWVIWIVLILIVGAGGGAALYFLRLV